MRLSCGAHQRIHCGNALDAPQEGPGPTNARVKSRLPRGLPYHKVGLGPIKIPCNAQDSLWHLGTPPCQDPKFPTLK